MDIYGNIQSVVSKSRSSHSYNSAQEINSKQSVGKYESTDVTITSQRLLKDRCGLGGSRLLSASPKAKGAKKPSILERRRLKALQES